MADRPDHDLADRLDEWASFAAEGYGPIDWDGFDHRLLIAAAARLRQLTDERDRWQEEARQYAENADYWRDRLNDHKASLAIQAFTAPDEDETVMMESLVARIGDLLVERDELRRELDAATEGTRRAAQALWGGE